MGKIKYQTREIQCKRCGSMTEGYARREAKDRGYRFRVYCLLCSVLHLDEFKKQPVEA